MLILVLISFAPMAFCLVRGAADIAERRYLWGAIGLLCGLLALLYMLLGTPWPGL